MTDETVTLGSLRPPTDEDHLEHFGIKGMKWGVRHLVGADGHISSAPGVPDHINREAHADAQRHARLSLSTQNSTTKLLYMRHAADVNAKARASADYKKAFLHHKPIEVNKVLNRQIATSAAIGAAFILYHLNGNTVKVNGPLLQNTSKAVVTGAKFAAKIGPKLITDYKFRQITKGF